jgi:hypothetical protein
VKATQTLPSTYIPYDNFRPSKWRKTHWVTWIFGIALAWLSYSFLGLVAEILRPDFQPRPLHFEVPTLERLGSIILIVFVLAIVFAIHEFIHAVFLWFFTSHRPIIVVGEGGLAVRLPSWYIPRGQFLVTNLAPFCVISLVGLLLLLVVPQRYISLTVFLTAMNTAGSIADITSSAYLLLHPPSIYLETEGTIYFDEHIGPNLVPEWKLRIRSLIEAAIAKLDPINGAG